MHPLLKNQILVQITEWAHDYPELINEIYQSLQRGLNLRLQDEIDSRSKMETALTLAWWEEIDGSKPINNMDWEVAARDILVKAYGTSGFGNELQKMVDGGVKPISKRKQQLLKKGRK